MLLRQSFETCTDIVKLVNFVQNCFESHGLCPFLLGLRGRKTSDGLLSSEDLKEGEVVTTSCLTVAGQRVLVWSKLTNDRFAVLTS